MSENPGNNSRPRNQRGNRNRNRGPRRDNDRRDQRRDEQRPPRRDDRRESGGHRDSRPAQRPAPAAGRPSVWQKLLTVLTFGLVRPKAAGPSPKRPRQPDAKPAKKPETPRENLRPAREPRQQAAVPSVDPDTVDTERLHIGNLSYDATESDLQGLFKGIGHVQNVDIVYNGRTHRSKGFGFVQMMSITDARRAVAELHGKSFMGRVLQLGPARSRGRDEREADDDKES